MATHNRFAELRIDEPNPSHEEPGVTATRRQRAKATKESAQVNKSAAAAQDTSTSSINVTSTPNEKPKEKGWEASMTLAQLKAYKEEQALKEHNKRFPPKPKQDPAPAKTKKAPAKTENAANINKAHFGLKNAQIADGGNARHANVARTEMDKYKPVPNPREAWVSGCGIEGCRVKAKHERREYAIKDPQRPNLIKKIQAKFGPDANELKTLTNFFELHKRDAETRKQHEESIKREGQ